MRPRRIVGGERGCCKAEVHDDNAWTLGGYSGHAGLFSSAEEVYVIANMLRGHYLGKRDDYFKPEDGEESSSEGRTSSKEAIGRSDGTQEHWKEAVQESIFQGIAWGIPVSQERPSGWTLKKM